MPILPSDNSALSELQGRHLWHAGLSSCSQRVRIALAEKKLDYVSHEIDLHAGENASAEYQEIHPKGLVPAMVIDGDLVIDSVDIINEIDRRYEEPLLRPEGKKHLKKMDALLSRADAAQSSLKLLTFEFLFSAAPPVSKERLEAFQQNHKNEALKQFHRDVAIGLSRKRISEAVDCSHRDFMHLDLVLSDGRQFLAGDEFSLADVAWMPNIHRFTLIKWPFDTYENLRGWFERVRERSSYKIGLTDWEPIEFVELVSPNIKARALIGDGVAAYIPEPPLMFWEGMSCFTK
jgi:glutathione S-transferase